jgi:hypothetical protein
MLLHQLLERCGSAGTCQAYYFYPANDYNDSAVIFSDAQQRFWGTDLENKLNEWELIDDRGNKVDDFYNQFLDRCESEYDWDFDMDVNLPVLTP